MQLDLLSEGEQSDARIPMGVSVQLPGLCFGWLFGLSCWVVGSFKLRVVGLGGGYVARRAEPAGGVLLRTGLGLREPDVPQRGPGALARGWGFGVCGACGPSGKVAASALSLGRSRRRCCGMKAVSQAVVVARADRAGASSLLAMLFWRRGGCDAAALPGRMLGRAFPTTWCRLRSFFWIISADGETEALTAVRCLRLRFVPGVLRLARIRGRKLLCGLFAEVLGLERVGIDDNSSRSGRQHRMISW